MPLSMSLLRIPVVGLLLAVASAQAWAQPPLNRAIATGEQVYLKVCVACHASGVAGAPKFGDKAAWAPLIQEGQPVLTGHAWVGVRAMPARGGSTDLSLQEFAAAVAYMARQAGADWKDPDRRMLLAIAKESDQKLAESMRELTAMRRELKALAAPK